MKPKKIQYLETALRVMAQAVLRKYHPTVVGITGSVGKTSTKEAVATVLALKFSVRKTEKNYNNEIGIPLTIIGAVSGNRSIFKWLGVVRKWIWIMILPVQYPEVLVLELGVDRPGDMDYLLNIVSPTIGVATNIASSHLEYFETLDNTAKEKGKLIEALPTDGFAILNADDERVRAMQSRTDAEVITFSMNNPGDVTASLISYPANGATPQGISFKVNYRGTSVPVRLRQVLAPHLVYAALGGIAVGLACKMNLVDIAAALEQFQPPAGRMNLIPGIKQSLVIDDTYNAAPSSTLLALDVIERMKAPRKIVVLGDMLELGEDLERGHREVGQKVFHSKAQIFIAVGKRMDIAVQMLRSLGFSREHIYHFPDPMTAGRMLQEIMQPGDLVLVKGSQGMRMEKVVEEVMAEPQKAGELLCRQSKEWLNKPFIEP